MKKNGQGIRHKAVSIEKDGKKLWLAGAGDLRKDHLNLDMLLKGVPDSDCRIVLAHNPDTADTDFNERIDLMISGHTHGGQICIPVATKLILAVKNKAYSSGLAKSNKGFSVFISKGVGFAMIPVRYKCDPEIAVLELVVEGGRGDSLRFT